MKNLVEAYVKVDVKVIDKVDGTRGYKGDIDAEGGGVEDERKVRAV